MSVEKVADYNKEDPTNREGEFCENNNYKCKVNFNIISRKKKHLRPSCIQFMKKQLTKYKLRYDGVEDPEIIDLCQILSQSVLFKTHNCELSEASDLDIETHPKNYIAKMVKNKKIAKRSKADLILKESKSIPSNKLEKKKNAFKLMMESRNKSIGGNSPGKAEVSEFNLENRVEIEEKKKNKIKNNLALMKMAEDKGAHKKKVLEEHREKHIKKKLEKRAEQFKLMLTKNCLKTYDQSINIDSELNLSCDNTALSPEVILNDDSNSALFNEEKAVPSNKNITQEDKEFLNKLSPSLRKKENMLCYFKKLDKKSDDAENKSHKIIKVKIAQAKKVHLKNKKSKVAKSDKPETANCNEKSEYVDSAPANKVDNANKYETKILKVNDSEIFKDTIPPSKRLSTKKKNPSMSKSNKIIAQDHNDPSHAVIAESNQNFYKSDDDSKSEKKNDACNDNSMEKNENLANENRRPRKRKRRPHLNKENPKINDAITSDSPNILERRPRRKVKKPVKYGEVEKFSSSDDEPVFTTKKKKSKVILDLQLPPPAKVIDLIQKADSNVNTTSNKKKLAPIFVPKPIVDTEAIEARQRFLHSGVPDQIKKIASQQKIQETVINSFPITVNICQHTKQSDHDNHQINFYKLTQDISDISNIKQECSYRNLLDLTSVQTIIQVTPNDITRKHDEFLKEIKNSYPEFPVYRTFRLLQNRSKGEPNIDVNMLGLDDSKETLSSDTDSHVHDPKILSWTEKYRACSSNHIIGNFDSIKEIKKWLDSWIERNMTTKSSQTCKDTDSSDFYHSDADSSDNVTLSNNVLVVCGPTGCGKTSSIHAVATELSIKVIEVNVSNKRSGKILLQELSEATQSHKVNRGKGGSADNSQNSQNSATSRKQNSKASKNRKNNLPELLNTPNVSNDLPNSQEEGRIGMSLILIDDADVVFDQDDGFISGITQLIQSSKRPLILITSSMTCLHLQRFYQCGNVVKLKPLLPKMLGTWLDIMCLADTAFCWPGTGEKLLELYKGDIRKAINLLQFFACSQKEKKYTKSIEDIKEEHDIKINIEDDENSSMSWAEKEAGDGAQNKHYPEARNYHNKSCITSSIYQVDIFETWWSAHEILKSETLDGKINNNECISKLHDMSQLFDCLSLADCLDHPPTKSNLYSLPWHRQELNSVYEKPSYEMVNNFSAICNETAHHLVQSALRRANDSSKVEDCNAPGFSLQREKDKVLSRHQLLTESLLPASILDRKSIALDYWSTFRTICRTEKSKTDTNSKRNNRFYHYLKTLKTSCKSEVFNKLCNSLDC